jgi:excisionase family DNA binding protein
MKNEKCVSDWVTTGEAAELCGVTSDTILKWIKSGKLHAAKTAGGHHRMRRKTLAPYLAVIERSDADNGKSQKNSFLICWQYYANKNGIRSKCKKCPVYLADSGANKQAGPAHDTRHSIDDSGGKR